MSWPVRNAWLDGCYRYTLHRAQARKLFDPPERTVGFVMLNPSKANARDDDPTLRRCMGFAEAWGFNRLVVGNLFAYVSTDPKALRDLSPAVRVGPQNDLALAEVSAESDLVVCAWGNLEPAFQERADAVLKVLQGLSSIKLQCLGRTKSGQPRHPVRLAAAVERVAYP